MPLAALARVLALLEVEGAAVVEDAVVEVAREQSVSHVLEVGREHGELAVADAALDELAEAVVAALDDAAQAAALRAALLTSRYDFVLMPCSMYSRTASTATASEEYVDDLSSLKRTFLFWKCALATTDPVFCGAEKYTCTPCSNFRRFRSFMP